MIIGNGLIAEAFKKSKIKFENCIVFASGVSNSQEQDEKEFKREKELIKSYIDGNKKFIYFSSIHLLDPSQQNLKYVKHKLEMESLIQEIFVDYIIYRLPIVMGRGGNKKSLFNFLFNAIKNQEKMEIQIKSHRYVIGVDDVVYFVSKTCHVNRKIIDLIFDKAFNIIEIIESFEKFLKTDAMYSTVDKGAFFSIKNDELKISLNNSVNLNKYSNSSYLDSIITHYYATSINKGTKG